MNIFGKTRKIIEAPKVSRERLIVENPMVISDGRWWPAPGLCVRHKASLGDQIFLPKAATWVLPCVLSVDQAYSSLFAS